MKKIVTFVLVLGVLFLVFQFGINLLKTSHAIDYKINVDDKEVSVHEEYYKDKSVDYYFFRVMVDNNEFVFDVDNYFNKQKEVLDDLEIYEQDNFMCISPIYMGEIEEADIICSVDNVQYSYAAMREEYDLTPFVTNLKYFDEEKYVSSDKASSASNHIVYKENMYDDEILLLYEYNDLIKVTNNKNTKINFATYDIYSNDFGVLIDKYYILPKYENLPEYKGLTIIDILTGDVSSLYIDEKLSTNIYVNGVVDNKLYFFDKSNLIQYEVDPSKSTYRVTGNKSTNGQYYDGTWSTKNIYEFVNENIKFTEQFPLEEAYLGAFESDKYYYYYNSNYEFYKVYKKDLSKKIYLFQMDNIKEIHMVHDGVYFIKDDSLYRYDDTGMKKLVMNKEFKYNYKNIYSVYF